MAHIHGSFRSLVHRTNIGLQNKYMEIRNALAL